MKVIDGTTRHEIAAEEFARQLPEDFNVADWVKATERSTLREMLATGARPEMLSFALGLPATELLPREAYSEALLETLQNDRMALQLGPPFHPLKQQIVELMAQRGVACREEQVFLTTGAQQALNLLANLLLNDGTPIMVEEVAYTGLHMVIQPHRPQVMTISTDPQQGININEVEQLLAGGARPAFIFAMSEGHNPLGISLSQRKRERLVEIARRYRVPIIEDDVYGFLNYESASATPPMRALDDQWVLYVSSFSKILGPGLRTGWIIAPEVLIPRLSIVKDLSDIDSCTLTQRAIATYLRSNHLSNHLLSIRRDYRERRDCMLHALEKHLSGVAEWATPTSGVFIWLRLPPGVNTVELLKIAVEREGVAFIPGKAFTVGRSECANECLRLNFTYCQREQIEEGVIKLARALKDLMRNSLHQ
jgi:2-aminoadipate transaminase